jgi:hypothetical protein
MRYARILLMYIKPLKLLQTLNSQPESRSLVLHREMQPPFRNFPPLDWVVKRPLRRIYLHAQILPIISEHLRKLLLHWLELPTVGSRASAQASFLQHITHVFGNKVLFLDCIWSAFRSPSTWITGNKKYSAKRMAHSLDNLVNHPLAQGDSKEKALLYKIAACYTRNLNIEDIQAQPASPQVNDLVDPICHLLRYSYAAHIIPEEKRKEISTLANLIWKDPDFYLALRELAPTRQLCLDPKNGLNDYNYMRTHVGLWNLLLLRGITWSTKAIVKDKRMRFKNLTDWESYVAHVQETHADAANYLCNPKAYGTYNSKRGPQHALAYWNGSSDWEKRCEEFQSFTEVFYYLKS